MTVTHRLQAAFAVYIALLAAVVMYHVHTIHGVVESGRAVTEISSRLRGISTDELTRLDDMNDDARKYVVTRDQRYMDKLVESAHAFGAQISLLNTAPLSSGERDALLPLVADWAGVELTAPSLNALATASLADARDAVSRLELSLDRIRAETQQLAVASQDAMRNELAKSEAAAASAERVSWFAAIGALVLSLLLSAQIIRSIMGPLGRLTEGTQAVAAGRFDYRIDAAGNDELSQVARAFDSMTERLNELDEMKRDFVAKVSHDLKTPLSSMQETNAALLDDVAGPLSAKQRQLITLNQDSSARLSSMLSKLLDLSRIEAGLEPDFQMIDVAQLVRRSVDRASLGRGRSGVRITHTEPEGRMLVRADAAGLGQVLDNLIENAIKFSPADGAIDVRIADWDSARQSLPSTRRGAPRRPVKGGAVLLTVADEGSGIPDDEKDRVFARFYQTDAGRAVGARGVGLGLAICEEIVTAHGGSIWVADNERRGSVFCVLLPGAVAALDAHAAQVAMAGPA